MFLRTLWRIAFGLSHALVGVLNIKLHVGGYNLERENTCYGWSGFYR